MKLKIILISFLFFHFTSCNAQSKSRRVSCNCAFTSINNIGLLAGENDEAFQIQTVNGFRYKNWLVGAGVGIDEYMYRSIPLFLQLRKELRLNKKVIFLYNDIGLNYPWLKSNQKVELTPSDYQHGLYYDGGLGYKITIHKQALVFSSGFSIKKFKENGSSTGCPFVGPCPNQKDVYEYSLKRLSFKLGFQL